MTHKEQVEEAEQCRWALLGGQDTEAGVVPPPSQVLIIIPGWLVSYTAGV